MMLELFCFLVSQSSFHVQLKRYKYKLYDRHNVDSQHDFQKVEKVEKQLQNAKNMRTN